MKMREWNKEQPEVVLLLHPMFASAAALYTLLGQHLGGEYRLLIPDLSGHGEDVHMPYRSAAEEALLIQQYLLDAGLTSIHLAYGASLGGTVLMELAQLPGLSFDHLYFESTSVLKNEPLLEYRLCHRYIQRRRFAMRNPIRSVKHMKFKYGKSVSEPLARQFIATDSDSIRSFIRDCTHVTLPELSPEQQRMCTFACGTKGKNARLSKTLLPARYPEAEHRIWENCGHCEKLVSAPEDYAAHLKTYL